MYRRGRSNTSHSECASRIFSLWESGTRDVLIQQKGIRRMRRGHASLVPHIKCLVIASDRCLYCSCIRWLVAGVLCSRSGGAAALACRTSDAFFSPDSAPRCPMQRISISFNVFPLYINNYPTRDIHLYPNYKRSLNCYSSGKCCLRGGCVARRGCSCCLR